MKPTVEEAIDRFGLDPTFGVKWGVAKRPDPLGVFKPGDLWVVLQGGRDDREATVYTNHRCSRSSADKDGTFRYHFFAPVEQGTLL